MRFALLGNHPDGLEMACCLVETGRHQLGAYTNSSLTSTIASRCGSDAKIVTDLEEILADPAIEAVIVASGPAHRAAHLRRSLQSERHVLCVHPPDSSADLAHEAAMIQNDTGHVLLPLLYEGLHPGILRLAELLHQENLRLGRSKLLRLQIHSTQTLLKAGGVKEQQLSLPGWQILRRLGGEVAEVGAFAAAEKMEAEETLLVSGRFNKGGLFDVNLVPCDPSAVWRLVVHGDQGQIDFLFPVGDPGPAYLTWQELGGEAHEEAWSLWDPWPTMVDVFERAIKEFDNKRNRVGEVYNPETKAPEPVLSQSITWQDSIRSLELDDATRRSVEKRRYSALEYAEANEEVGFKGTMTLVGCALIWILLLLVILSRWVPQLGWVIVPVLLIFLGMQLLRWIIPRTNQPDAKKTSSGKVGQITQRIEE